MKTSGNTVFISGGSAGIGLAIAQKLAGAGNKVIINGRNAGRLNQALSTLPSAVAIQGDLSVPEDRRRIAQTLKDQHPEINIIINNAGAAFMNNLNDSANEASEKAQQEINTNYISVIDFTALMLPTLLLRESAAVINITSIAVFRGNKFVPTYAASKAALHSYTQGLRDTFADQENLSIYEVYPPLVNTEFSAEIGGANGIPPSDVAEELFLALASDQHEVPVGESKKIHTLVEGAIAQSGE